MHSVKKREFLKSFVLNKTRVTLTCNLEKVLSLFKICLNCKNFSSYLVSIHIFYPSLFLSIYHRLERLNFWLLFSAKIKLIYKVKQSLTLGIFINNFDVEIFALREIKKQCFLISFNLILRIFQRELGCSATLYVLRLKKLWTH